MKANKKQITLMASYKSVLDCGEILISEKKMGNNTPSLVQIVESCMIKKMHDLNNSHYKLRKRKPDFEFSSNAVNISNSLHFHVNSKIENMQGNISSYASEAFEEHYKTVLNELLISNILGLSQEGEK